MFTKVQITENPQSTPVNEGDDVVFSVTATGDAPLSYQWLMNGDPVGEDDSVHTLRSATPQDSGLRYSCIASNAFSCDTSLEAVLSVTPTSIYTVKFDTDGGSSVDSQRVKEGDTAKQPEEDPVKISDPVGK